MSNTQTSSPLSRLIKRVDGVKGGIYWDPKGGHGDGLVGLARDRVIKFVGTGSTEGWGM